MVATLSDQISIPLLNKIKENLQPGPSHHRNERLWKAPIPNKIKNFMWRLAKNILPTRHNLQRKGIVLDTSCPLCHSEAETVEHLFMNCNLSKLALFASPLRSHSPFNMDLHSYLVLIRMARSCSALSSGCFGMLEIKLFLMGPLQTPLI